MIIHTGGWGNRISPVKVCNFNRGYVIYGTFLIAAQDPSAYLRRTRSVESLRLNVRRTPRKFVQGGYRLRRTPYV